MGAYQRPQRPGGEHQRVVQLGLGRRVRRIGRPGAEEVPGKDTGVLPTVEEQLCGERRFAVVGEEVELLQQVDVAAGLVGTAATATGT